LGKIAKNPRLQNPYYNGQIKQKLAAQLEEKYPSSKPLKVFYAPQPANN